MGFQFTESRSHEFARPVLLKLVGHNPSAYVKLPCPFKGGVGKEKDTDTITRVLSLRGVRGSFYLLSTEDCSTLQEEGGMLCRNVTQKHLGYLIYLIVLMDYKNLIFCLCLTRASARTTKKSNQL